MRQAPVNSYYPEEGEFGEPYPAEFSLSALIDGMKDYAIVMFDSKGIVVSWNLSAELMSGYAAAEILGQRNEIFYSAEDRQKGLPAQNLKMVMEQGHYECSSWRVRKDGSRFLANIVFSTLLDSKKQIVGYSTITRDITEQKKAQDKTAYVGKLMEDISDAVISMTSDFKLKSWNKASERLYGYKSMEVLGRPIEEVLSLRLTPELRAAFRKELNENGYWRGEVIHVHQDRTEMTILVSVSQTLGDMEEPGGYVMVCKDISERKKLEDELRDFNESLEVEAKEGVRLIMESERKYKMLFESNPMPMWMLSLETFRTIDVNIAALRHYGYTREEFLSLDSRKMRPSEEEPRFLEDMRMRMQGVTNRGHWLHRKKGGELVHTEISVYDFESEGKPTRLVLANDITEQIRTEEKLKKSYEEIRELASHLQDVREEERASIAREIHDELGQQLTGLKMDFSWLSRKLAQDDEIAREKMASSLALLDDAIKTIRRISTELRPGILDDLGLVPAIEWQAEEFQKRFSIRTHFTTDVSHINFPAGISIGLFRICQESLTNIARHAGASKVLITLNMEGETVFLNITDNGKGFQQEQHGDRKTLGLFGMKERALMMGGKFEIESGRGGTSVLVSIPFNIIG
ncbi:MAG: PAS domain S-box protein [Bacteroidota bacterium]|nr:PAS domain S-box protein [Bacteroidota bacterium]